MSELRVLAKWLARVIKDVGPSPVVELRIDLPAASWTSFEKIFSVTEMIRSTTLQVGGQLIHTREARGRSVGLESVLNEAIDPGLQARASGWDQEQLRAEFQAWKREVKARPCVKQQIRQIGRDRWRKSHTPVRAR